MKPASLDGSAVSPAGASAAAAVTVALSRGRLFDGARALFARAGLPFPDEPGRRLAVSVDGMRFLFVKDRDVPTYVEHGVADCGVAGADVLLETRPDVYAPLDLGFGRCRLVVAAPEGAGFDYRRVASLRVATKYPRLAAEHFLARGVAAEVVTLSGSVELAPGLGLADCIVDVVETGRTLAENGLEVVEEVARSAARLVVNRASLHARPAAVARVVERLAEVVA